MFATMFHDRHDAGRQLAERVSVLATTVRLAESALVLALPRGGTPVAYEVATSLHLPLDVLPVRKLGWPGNEEVAIGAIASVNDDMITVLDDAVLALHPELRSPLERIMSRESAELRRQRDAYRGTRPPLDLNRRDVVLIDDGLATGATMRAAVRAAHAAHARRIIVAIPVVDCDAYAEICRTVDACTCVIGTDHLEAVSVWYQDFSPVSDGEVTALLAAADQRLALELAAMS